MTKKIAITTPTGKSGRYLTERLLDAVQEKQLEIVLLARDPARVRSFTERGARVENGSLDFRFACGTVSPGPVAAP